MTFVLEVGLASFNEYKTENLSFFWTETKKEFILIKVFPALVVRTAVMKTTPEADDSFKVRNLLKHNAKFVLGMTVDGVSTIVKPKPEEQTEGNVFEEPEKEEGVKE